MKKKLLIVLSALISCVVLFGLAACRSGTVLETPENLQITDDYLTWDEVEGAKEYIVEVDGEDYQTATNSLDVMEIISVPKVYTFAVYALGDGKKTLSSGFSEELRYEALEPVNLTVKPNGDGTGEISAIYSLSDRKELVGKLIIPEEYDGVSITSIGSEGFRQCPNITSVYIPDSVQKMGGSAFFYCTSLKRVRMPKNLENIPLEAFSNCPSLTEIEIPEKVKILSGKSFYKCSSLEKITLHEGLEEIGKDTFYGCSSLSELKIPHSIKKIDSKWMKNCDSLRVLEIAQGETDVYKTEGNCLIRKSDNTLLVGCNAATIPDYVETIGEEAFKGRKITEEIYLPASVKEIEKNAFRKCVNLKKISVAEDNAVFKSDADCIIRKADNTLVVGCAATDIPDYVKIIGEGAFAEQTGLTKIFIPNGVTEIGGMAFEFCKNVREIYIPNSVNYVGKNAFYGCCYASVTLPDGMEVSKSGNIDPHIGSYTAHNNSSFQGGNYGNSVLAYDDGSAYPYVYSVELRYYTLHEYGIPSWQQKTALVSPVRIGYTFCGWTTVEGAAAAMYMPITISVPHEDDYNGQIIFTVAENVSVTYIQDDNQLYGKTLYAVWEKNN